MPTKDDLKYLQSLPLHIKIRRTQAKIIEFYLRNNGQVYISFSGGKDSTVLLDITRRIFPDIQAVFVDTGLEYPEIRDFVKTIDNVRWLYPKVNFKKVVEKYGYPIIGKEVSKVIRNARSGQQSALNKLNGLKKDSNGEKSKYNCESHKYLLDAPFLISEECCDKTNKDPCKLFEKETGKKMITGEMASESALRQSKWLQNGCNAFNLDRPKSTPMSFWLEQDVLQYLLISGIQYSEAYGDIVPKSEFQGQLAIEGVQTDLMTTGCERTGCMFCGFGAHLEEEPNRFQRMKITHLRQYDFCMREKNGLGMAKVLDYIGVKY